MYTIIQLTVYNATSSEYWLVHVMNVICTTKVEGCFECFFCHAHLKPPHIESYKAVELWHQNKAIQYVINLFSAILCDSVGQWILFGVGH